MPNTTDLLKEDHEKVKALFRQFEAVEEESAYPAVRTLEDAGELDELGDSSQPHAARRRAHASRAAHRRAA